MSRRMNWFDDGQMRNTLTYSKDTEFLNAMSNHKDSWIRMLVCQNIHTSIIVLERLAVEDSHESVRWAATMNPSLTEESLDYIIRRKPTGYLQVHKNPNCSLEQLTQLYNTSSEPAVTMAGLRTGIIEVVKKRKLLADFPDEWVESFLLEGETVQL